MSAVSLPTVGSAAPHVTKSPSASPLQHHRSLSPPSTSAHTRLSSRSSLYSGSRAQFAPKIASTSTAATKTTLPTCAAAATPGAKGTIAVTGASGLVGVRLVQELAARGYAVRVLTRNPSAARNKLRLPGVEFFVPSQWPNAIRGARAVVNLAGEPIATRWTPELKAEIKRSRVQTTSALANAINALPEGERPEVLVSSSAVGYYGASDTATFNESSASGGDYLAEVCREWEAAAGKAQTRVVVLRTGIVLAKDGGALSKMIPVFQIFAGGPLGSGKQWCSWIHRDDLVGMIVSAIEDGSWKGTYNATAPNPVRMGELCAALGQAMGRPSFFPVPDFALKTLLGEGARVVLDGQRVLPAAAQNQGYQFRYSRVQDALRNIMG